MAEAPRLSNPPERAPDQSYTLVRTVRSTALLEQARNAPLTPESLRHHLGKFGGTGYALGHLEVALEGEVILPIGELNRLRRELVFQLDAARTAKPPGDRRRRDSICSHPGSAPTPLPSMHPRACESSAARWSNSTPRFPRTSTEVYVDFEDIRRYKDAVENVRGSASGARIFPRHAAHSESRRAGILPAHRERRARWRAHPQSRRHRAFQKLRPARRIGDFSLNVANPLTAAFFMDQGLERVTDQLRSKHRAGARSPDAAPPAVVRTHDSPAHAHVSHGALRLRGVHVERQETTPIADALVKSIASISATASGSIIPCARTSAAETRSSTPSPKPAPDSSATSQPPACATSASNCWKRMRSSPAKSSALTNCSSAAKAKAKPSGAP